LFRFEIVKVACPPFRELVPRVLEPSLKVTVPVGAAIPGAVTATLAVKVIDWLCADGFTEVVTAVLVPAGFTVWESAAEVLAPKVESPL
jgi:hypothetical protein